MTSESEKPKRPLYKRPGCLIPLALFTIIVLFVAYILISAGIEERRSEEAFAVMEDAFAEGDCETVNDQYSNVGTTTDIYQKALPLYGVCSDYTSALAYQEEGNYPDAILEYADFLEYSHDRRGPILTENTIKQLEIMMEEAEPIELVNEDVCLTISGNIIFSKPAHFNSLLEFGCGEYYIAQGDEDRAMTYFESVALSSRDDDLVADAEAELARLGWEMPSEEEAIEQPPEEEVIELPPLTAVGSVGGDKAVLTIRNVSPVALSITFTGPTTHSSTIPACGVCIVYSSAPNTCPELGPVESFELPPGTYTVTVTGEGVPQSFRGTWVLDAGMEYAHCFYLVSAP